MQTARKMVLSGYKMPTMECMVEFEFDLERAIRILAERAYVNKSKKTKCGLMTVKVRPTTAAKEKAAETAKVVSLFS